MTQTSINGWQGVVALVGLTVGLVPAGQHVLVGSAGSIWRLLLHDPSGTSGWAGPVAVMTVAVVVIAVLESRRHRL